MSQLKSFKITLVVAVEERCRYTGMVVSSQVSVSDYESSASLTVAACTGKNLRTWCRPFHCWRCGTSCSCIQSWQMESHPTPSRAIAQESPWPAHDGGLQEWAPSIIQCSHKCRICCLNGRLMLTSHGCTGGVWPPGITATSMSCMVSGFDVLSCVSFMRSSKLAGFVRLSKQHHY